MSKWGSLLLFLILVFFVQVLGAHFTSSSVFSWYPTLIKAKWNPPAWVFGPVWTILYLLIAIAGWQIHLKPQSKLKTQALLIYFIQLLLNGLWSYFFFYLKSPLLGLIDIFLLLIFIIWSLYLFKSLSKRAFYLFIPYFLWTLYAATLNFATWILN